MLLIREKEISMQIEELNCGAIWEILIFIVYSNSKNRQFCFYWHFHSNLIEEKGKETIY